MDAKTIRSYPRTFWSWPISLFGHSAFTRLYRLFTGVQPSGPSLVHPRIEASRRSEHCPRSFRRRITPSHVRVGTPGITGLNRWFSPPLILLERPCGRFTDPSSGRNRLKATAFRLTREARQSCGQLTNAQSPDVPGGVPIGVGPRDRNLDRGISLGDFRLSFSQWPHSAHVRLTCCAGPPSPGGRPPVAALYDEEGDQLRERPAGEPVASVPAPNREPLADARRSLRRRSRERCLWQLRRSPC